MKTEQLLEQIEKTQEITEQQVKLLQQRLNNGEAIDLSLIWDGEIKLTPEQNKKGIEFLLNQWKTPRGIERKNNPFGYREEHVLETFTHFELRGFHDVSRYGQRAYYLPLYVCCGDGAFEYYYNGTVNIVG